MISSAMNDPSTQRARALAVLNATFDEDRREKIVYCVLIRRVLLADGVLSPIELVFLAQVMDRYALTVEDRRAVEVDARSIAELTASLADDARAELVRTLEAAAWVDGRLSPEEDAVLDDICRALR